MPSPLSCIDAAPWMKVTILAGGVHADRQALEDARFGHRALLASNVITTQSLLDVLRQCSRHIAP